MNILFINNFFCRIYSFLDTESVRIRVLSVFGHFLYLYYIGYIGISHIIKTYCQTIGY